MCMRVWGKWMVSWMMERESKEVFWMMERESEEKQLEERRYRCCYTTSHSLHLPCLCAPLLSAWLVCWSCSPHQAPGDCWQQLMLHHPHSAAGGYRMSDAQTPRLRSCSVNVQEALNAATRIQFSGEL